MVKKEFKMVNIKYLTPYERNPRINKEAVLDCIESIKQCENLDPIEIDENGIVLSGHTRLKALKRLGYKETEVIQYTGLSEEQKRKYRILTNKTGEKAEWDLDLLKIELEGLDFEGFDFSFELEEPRKRKKAENFTDREIDTLPRLQHNTFDNFDREFRTEYTGKYGIPVMEPTHTIGTEFMRFCDWKENENLDDMIAHFYYDDYKFIQAWKEPDLYVDRLRKFKAVISPDFSLYTDFPLALQIMSCYRRQWVGAYWQSLGLDVIPDVVWGEPETFEFCFDGIPKGGTVAVSSVGVKNDKEWNGKSGNLFKRGYDEMMNRLEPETVLFYGRLFDGLGGNIIRIPSFYEQRREVLLCGKRK